MGNEQTGKEAWSADDERGREISPAPIATPEEVRPARKTALMIVAGYPFKSAEAVEQITRDIEVALASSAAEIERLTRERDEARSGLEEIATVIEPHWRGAGGSASPDWIIREMLGIVNDAGADKDRAEAAEARIATLTAEVGRMRGLLDEAAGYLEGEGYYTEAGRYRAALSPEPEAKETHR